MPHLFKTEMGLNKAMGIFKYDFIREKLPEYSVTRNNRLKKNSQILQNYSKPHTQITFHIEYYIYRLYTILYFGNSPMVELQDDE